MQLCSCKRRSEVGGNLAEEKKLLSLAWSEVRGGLVVKDERLIAALVESFGRRSRCGRKKKLVCRGERKVHGGSWWSVGGFVGFMWWSWWWRSWLWLERRGERGRKKLQKQGQRGWFLADFGLHFLLAQAMKCTPIYWRRKRDIFSLMVPNCGL